MEGTYTQTTLQNPNPEKSSSTVRQPGMAGDLNARVKWDYLRLRADLTYADLSYVLINAPSFVPFQALSSQLATITPELFTAVGADYFIESLSLTVGATGGIEWPATFKGHLPDSFANALPQEALPSSRSSWFAPRASSTSCRRTTMSYQSTPASSTPSCSSASSACSPKCSWAMTTTSRICNASTTIRSRCRRACSRTLATRLQRGLPGAPVKHVGEASPRFLRLTRIPKGADMSTWFKLTVTALFALGGAACSGRSNSTSNNNNYHYTGGDTASGGDPGGGTSYTVTTVANAWANLSGFSGTAIEIDGAVVVARTTPYTSTSSSCTNTDHMVETFYIQDSAAAKASASTVAARTPPTRTIFLTLVMSSL